MSVFRKLMGSAPLWRATQKSAQKWPFGGEISCFLMGGETYMSDIQAARKIDYFGANGRRLVFTRFSRHFLLGGAYSIGLRNVFRRFPRHVVWDDVTLRSNLCEVKCK